MQPQEVEQLLAACGSHVNEERKAGEAAATQLMKKKDCVPLLVAQLSHSQNPGVRQLASILLRKKIVGHWRKLNQATKTEMKQTLLKCAAMEPIRVVKLGIAHCIAMLAKAEVASGTWPELFEFLKTNSQSPEAAMRELVILILHACSETMSAQLGSQAGVISQFLMQGLADSEQSIRVRTLKAASAFLLVIDLDPSVITQLLPSMFQVLQASISSDDEELFTTAFDLLDDLLETPSFKGKNDTLTQIIQFSIHIGSGTTTNLKYREKACDILAKVAYMRPKTITKGNFVEPICQVAMSLLGDRACTVCSLEPDEDVMSHVGIGSHLLDAMATGLPSRLIAPPMLGWIKQQVVDVATADPFMKKASILALGALSCGCRDLLREKIEFVVDLTKQCVCDPNPMVKEAALVSSSMLTDYLQPEILNYHEVLLPLATDLLSDANPYVREKAALLVDSFAENLEDEVLPYAQQLMIKLAAIITTNVGPDGMMAQCVAVSAVSSVAQALGTKFAPFAEETFKILIPILRETKDEVIMLRARATDTIGVVASAAGAEHFNHHLASVMQLVAEGLALEAPELNEYSFGFWANMAEMYPKEMGQNLAVTMPHLCATLDTKAGELVSSLNPFGQLPGTNIADESDDSEPEDTESEEYDGVTRVDNKQNLAIASALHCLGIFAKTGDLSLEPFFVEIYARVLEFVQHFHTMVRKNALMLQVYLTMWTHKKNFVPVVIGLPSEDTLCEELRASVQEALMVALQIIRNDDNKEVVAQACDGISEIAEKIGAVAVHNHVDAILGEIKSLMNLSTPCQLVDESDEEGEEMPEDHDQLLIDSVFEMVDKLAKAYGPGFRQIFDDLLPHITKYLAKGRPASDHYMAIGTLGECTAAIDTKITGHVATLVKICCEGMKSTDSGVRSNSCFTVGVTCKGGLQEAFPFYPTILPLLGEIIGREGERKEAVDNAVSALCRMIKCNPAACFLLQTMPVILPHVPLKADFTENENVYSTVKLVLETMHDVSVPLLPQILQCLAKGLAHEFTQPEIKKVATENPAAIRAVASTLPQDVQQVLASAVTIPQA